MDVTLFHLKIGLKLQQEMQGVAIRMLSKIAHEKHFHEMKHNRLIW